MQLFRSPPIRSMIGNSGADLLPGLSKFMGSAHFTWVVCRDCGRGEFYATQETLERIGPQAGWNRLL